MTNKARRIEWTALCLSIALLWAGCAHEAGRIPAEKEAPPLLQAPAGRVMEQRLEEIERRIGYVKNLLENNQLSAGDRSLARDILNTYQAIGKASSPTGEELRNLVELLASNLMQLEERYFKRPSFEEAGREAVEILTRKRKSISDSYLAGDYQGVIDGCVELERVLGSDSLTPEIGLVFAISLGKRGMVREALRVGAKISDDLERKPGFIQLQASMIEWQLALGDRKAATEIYEKLVDNMHERDAVLRNAEQNLSGRGAPQKTAPRARTEPAPSTGLERESASVREVLRQVDASVQRGDFDTAKLLLLRFRIRLHDGPDAELVDQAMRSVESAEEKSRGQQNLETSLEEEALELAANLIEQEKYEEAITEIETLGQGNKLSLHARKLQDLAVEKIITRERNKAAKLFLMARNTSDPAKKEELLVSSYSILKALVEKYPASPLSPKINDNIMRIEEELSKLRNRLS